MQDDFTELSKQIEKFVKELNGGMVTTETITQIYRGGYDKGYEQAVRDCQTPYPNVKPEYGFSSRTVLIILGFIGFVVGFLN